MHARERLTQRIPMRAARTVAAVLFVTFGLATIVNTVSGND
jgi:putative Ca2+/H+ antiporter (TMEM165/GDT1 family)